MEDRPEFDYLQERLKLEERALRHVVEQYIENPDFLFDLLIEQARNYAIVNDAFHSADGMLAETQVIIAMDPDKINMVLENSEPGRAHGYTSRQVWRTSRAANLQDQAALDKEKGQ